MEQTIKYPIGIQTFEKLRKGEYLYVDKTSLIYDLVKRNQYVFLGRPRRFGKSLLISTLQAYFEGRKELFEGLAVAELEKEWRRHPVIRIDLSGESYEHPDKVKARLHFLLSEYEKQYGTDSAETTPATRFAGLIRRAEQKAGQKVVILIDEYDKPMVDNFHKDRLIEDFKTELRGFYSVIKESDAHIRFAMLTGVTKFAHVSIFSGLNNLVDISLNERYNAICGITETEFRRDFAESVGCFANATGKTEDEVWDAFRKSYDGYHFSTVEEGIYNPFSVLYAFNDNKLGEYWFASGTPSFLTELLKKYEFPLEDLEEAELSASDLADLTNPAASYHALFYQTGYLTIKGYDEDYQLYKLGFPNMEVRNGFWNSLYKDFILSGRRTSPFSLKKFTEDILYGKVEDFLQRLQALIGQISPQRELNKEIHFQNILQIIFTMLGFRMQSEITFATGRADMIVQTPDYVYVMEFKINGSPEAAIRQIREKNYAVPFKSDPRTVYLIGAKFNSETNQLESYQIEKY